MPFDGQEAHGHAVSAGLGQRDAQLGAFADEEGVGNLDEDAGAVAGLRVATRRAAMGEVDEHLKALADDLVAFFAADVRDQSHAAGIVLIARMIEALRLRWAETAIRRFHGSLCEQNFRCGRLAMMRNTQPLCDSEHEKSPCQQIERFA